MSGRSDEPQRLILGTRGSALALAQVELVKQALHNVFPSLEIEVKKITTSGDRSQTSEILTARANENGGAGLKGMFTKEIEEALFRGEIDVAVHSLKDLPGQMQSGFAVVAVLERAQTGDVLIFKKSAQNSGDFSSLPSLKKGARIGTSSVRRRKQLLWLRTDLIVEPLRGNVPTRLRKLHESDALDAIVLARAGLDRLGFSPKLSTANEGVLFFENAEFGVEILPVAHAIGQGAIGLEIHSDNAESARVKTILRAINHEPTFVCVRAERELLRLLDGARLHLKAMIFEDDGKPPRTGEAIGNADAPEAIAAQVFQQLYDDEK